MAGSRKSGKWRAVMKKPAVRHTMKAVSAVFKCLMTILLIGVITATMVGCVMVVYVMINFKDNDGIPTELGQMSMKATTTVEVQNDKGEWEVFQQLKGTNSIWVDGEDIPPVHEGRRGRYRGRTVLRSLRRGLEADDFRLRQPVSTSAPPNTAAPPSHSS